MPADTDTSPKVTTLLAIDIGNSCIKLGRFDRSTECEQSAQMRLLPIAGAMLPEPVAELSIPTAELGDAAPASIADWLADQQLPSVRAAVASVNRPVEPQLVQALEQYASQNQLACEITSITANRLPLEVELAAPERVGIDRLLGAVAANRLRRPDRAAIVVDLGTAITVDLVTADGVFAGGAILPGIAMSSRALHEQTDALPPSRMEKLDQSPDSVGKDTQQAIEAGLFWGAVGAVRELIARQSDRLVDSPQVFLTGGAAPSVARLIAGPERAVRYVPHLVLSGIAVAMESSR